MTGASSGATARPPQFLAPPAGGDNPEFPMFRRAVRAIVEERLFELGLLP
jgi:hypothetical protein